MLTFKICQYIFYLLFVHLINDKNQQFVVTEVLLTQVTLSQLILTS